MSTGATESLQGTHWGTVTLGECADSRRMCRQEIGVPTGDESLQLTIELGELDMPTEDGFAGRRCL